jgi:hypothetical protein
MAKQGHAFAVEDHMKPLFFFKPAFTNRDINFERDVEVYRLGHFLADPLGAAFRFRGRQFEHQFVVDLEDHFDWQVLCLDFVLDIYHGNFYQVGGGALDDGVDGEAFSLGDQLLLSAVDLADGPTAMEDGFCVTGLSGAIYYFVHEIFYRAVAGEVVFDEFFSFSLCYANPAGKSEGALAINDAKIDSFAA